MKEPKDEFLGDLCPAFLPPPQELVLGPDEVHIWWANLDLLERQLHRFIRTLSTDEHKRAAQFHFEESRRRYITRHGILRSILGSYRKIEPSSVQFYYGMGGKPVLADTFGDATIHFSMSSSQGIALYGFTRNREIGVDVERIRDIPEMDHVAQVILSAKEIRVYRALPMRLRKEAFFSSWTQREAFVKATGDGLSQTLDKGESTVERREPDELLEINPDGRIVPGWSILNFKPDERFVAAIGVQRGSWTLRCRQWIECNLAQLSA